MTNAINSVSYSHVGRYLKDLGVSFYSHDLRGFERSAAVDGMMVSFLILWNLLFSHLLKKVIVGGSHLPYSHFCEEMIGHLFLEHII